MKYNLILILLILLLPVVHGYGLFVDEPKLVWYDDVEPRNAPPDRFCNRGAVFECNENTDWCYGEADDYCYSHDSTRSKNGTHSLTNSGGLRFSDFHVNPNDGDNPKLPTDETNASLCCWMNIDVSVATGSKYGYMTISPVGDVREGHIVLGTNQSINGNYRFGNRFNLSSIESDSFIPIIYNKFILSCIYANLTGNGLEFYILDNRDFVKLGSYNGNAWGDDWFGFNAGDGEIYFDSCFNAQGNVTELPLIESGSIAVVSPTSDYTVNETVPFTIQCDDDQLNRINASIYYTDSNPEFNFTGGYFYFETEIINYTDVWVASDSESLTLNIDFPLSGNVTAFWQCFDNNTEGSLTVNATISIIDIGDVAESEGIDIFDYDFSVATNVLIFMALCFFYIGIMFFALKTSQFGFIIFGFLIGVFIGLLLIGFSGFVALIFILMNIYICIRADFKER